MTGIPTPTCFCVMYSGAASTRVMAAWMRLAWPAALLTLMLSSAVFKLAKVAAGRCPAVTKALTSDRSAAESSTSGNSALVSAFNPAMPLAMFFC